MTRSTAESGRQCRCSSRIAALRLVGLWAVCWLLLAAPSNAAFFREIFDAGDPFNDTAAYLDAYSSVDNYYFGRSEGMPVRGPNPVPGPQYGSTDVDSLYDLVPVVHSYYVNVLGRNGPNGLGGMGNGTSRPFNDYRIFANVNVIPGTSRQNFAAFAGTGDISVATGAAHDYDLLGHEINHLQSRFLRQNPDGSFVHLPSTGESGALNEGLADFFGEGFERYVTGTNDWLFTIPNVTDGHIEVNRNLSNPESLVDPTTGTPYPDHYFSPDFYTGSLDAGGIHHNSSVLTYAAYLAVEGGTFQGRTITGIGFDKVEQILERAATVYFQSNETYRDAYGHIIQAASDLYGPNDVYQITQALQAVEMNGVPVPEPSTFVLAATAVLGLIGVRLGRRRQPS